MKEISIQQLQQDANQWVKVAANQEPIVITEAGNPIAILTTFEAKRPPGHLPDREERINRRSTVKIDSADYISEMRG